jgi:hypothetical protein
VGFRGERAFQTVLRAAGEIETTQENIQHWLQLDEGETLNFRFWQRINMLK